MAILKALTCIIVLSTVDKVLTDEKTDLAKYVHKYQRIVRMRAGADPVQCKRRLTHAFLITQLLPVARKPSDHDCCWLGEVRGAREE